MAGVAILYFINKPRGMVTAHVVGGLTVTLLCFVLIPKLGAAGAAWGDLDCRELHIVNHTAFLRGPYREGKPRTPNTYWAGICGCRFFYKRRNCMAHSQRHR